MAGVRALLTPSRKKKKYGQGTVLTGMRRCEVSERYRLSPERIECVFIFPSLKNNIDAQHRAKIIPARSEDSGR